MKKTFGFIFLVILFMASFVAFFPKEKLYFLLQKELLVHNISIDSQDITDYPFSIALNNNNILLSGSEVVSIEKVNISLTGIDADNIKGINSFKSIIPDIKSLNLNYTIGQFMSAKGNFGEVTGRLDISKKKLVFDANIKHKSWVKYNTIFSNFKKKGDKYSYEFNF